MVIISLYNIDKYLNHIHFTHVLQTQHYFPNAEKQNLSLSVPSGWSSSKRRFQTITVIAHSCPHKIRWPHKQNVRFHTSIFFPIQSTSTIPFDSGYLKNSFDSGSLVYLKDPEPFCNSFDKTVYLVFISRSHDMGYTCVSPIRCTRHPFSISFFQSHSIASQCSSFQNLN